MHRVRIGYGIVSILLVLSLGVGCKSGGEPSSSGTTMTSPQKAIVISGGNGGGTRIFFPSQDGKSMETLSTEGTAECAQCRADAEHYFLTGEMAPKCSMCGATRTPVTNYTNYNTLKTLGHN